MKYGLGSSKGTSSGFARTCVALAAHAYASLPVQINTRPTIKQRCPLLFGWIEPARAKQWKSLAYHQIKPHNDRRRAVGALAGTYQQQSSTWPDAAGEDGDVLCEVGMMESLQTLKQTNKAICLPRSLATLHPALL